MRYSHWTPLEITFCYRVKVIFLRVWIVILLLVIGCSQSGKQEERVIESEVKEVRVTNDTTETTLEIKKEIEAEILRAEEQIYSGRYYEAISLLRELIEIDPENAKLHYLLGRAYEDIGLDELSIQSYMKAIQLDSDIASNFEEKRG